MVIIFSNRKCKYEEEIVEILKKYDANYISDKKISESNGKFTIVSTYKKTEINMEKGIAVFAEKSLRFKEQKFPIGLVGVCEENNHQGLEVFKKSRNAVITCGSNNKNTITLSSFNNDYILATLQRSFYDIEGNIIEPSDLRIKLSKNFSPFSVLCSAIILLYHGITPSVF